MAMRACARADAHRASAGGCGVVVCVLDMVVAVRARM